MDVARSRNLTAPDLPWISLAHKDLSISRSRHASGTVQLPDTQRTGSVIIELHRHRTFFFMTQHMEVLPNCWKVPYFLLIMLQYHGTAMFMHAFRQAPNAWIHASPNAWMHASISMNACFGAGLIFMHASKVGLLFMKKKVGSAWFIGNSGVDFMVQCTSITRSRFFSSFPTAGFEPGTPRWKPWFGFGTTAPRYYVTSYLSIWFVKERSHKCIWYCQDHAKAGRIIVYPKCALPRHPEGMLFTHSMVGATMIILHSWAYFQASGIKYHADKRNAPRCPSLDHENVWRRDIHVYTRSSQGISTPRSRQISSTATYSSASYLDRRQAHRPSQLQRTTFCPTPARYSLDIKQDHLGTIVNIRLSSILRWNILQAAHLGVNSGVKRW